jgi:hypothetical protein
MKLSLGLPVSFSFNITLQSGAEERYVFGPSRTAQEI